jgi:spermidine synthase
MPDRPGASPLLRSAVLLLFFLSGATAFVYEVVWVRQLSLVFGVTIYAVTTVLATFMGGLALGS